MVGDCHQMKRYRQQESHDSSDSDSEALRAFAANGFDPQLVRAEQEAEEHHSKLADQAYQTEQQLAKRARENAPRGEGGCAGLTMLGWAGCAGLTVLGWAGCAWLTVLGGLDWAGCAWLAGVHILRMAGRSSVVPVIVPAAVTCHLRCCCCRSALRCTALQLRARYKSWNHNVAATTGILGLLQEWVP